MNPTLVCFSLVAALAMSPGCKKNPPPAEESAAPAETPKAAAAEPTGGETASPDEYQGADAVAGAGTISGTISYLGKETDAKVTITKDDATCCAACKVKEKMANTLVVSGGKLANAVVWLADVKKGKKMDKAAVTVNNTGCEFNPHVAIGFKGGTVAAKNNDPVLHNTHLFLQQGNKDLVNIALPNQGQVVEKPLKKPGVVSVKCDAHEWMQAYVFVASNPYATVSGADGTFKLDGVPPGDYAVKVWHERLGEKDGKVTVAPGGAAKLDFAFN
jgi:plastocyanin